MESKRGDVCLNWEQNKICVLKIVLGNIANSFANVWAVKINAQDLILFFLSKKKKNKKIILRRVPLRTEVRKGWETNTSDAWREHISGRSTDVQRHLHHIRTFHVELKSSPSFLRRYLPPNYSAIWFEMAVGTQIGTFLGLSVQITNYLKKTF